MSQPDLNRMLACADWAGAAAILAPMTRAHTAHPSLIYNYAKVLLEMTRMKEAQAQFERVVRISPDHANAWFELGRAALAQSDYQTALNAFDHALALSPDDIDARRNLARLALRLGLYAQARAAWQPLGDDPEAALALYRIAAETRAPDVAARRAALLATHPDRAAVIRTLVRVAKGAVPLVLPKRDQ